MSELLPCPFCGSEARLAKAPKNELWQIFCTNQKCSAFGVETSPEKAIKAWNRRAQPHRGGWLRGHITRLDIICILDEESADISKPVDCGRIADRIIALGRPAQTQGCDMCNDTGEITVYETGGMAIGISPCPRGCKASPAPSETLRCTCGVEKGGWHSPECKVHVTAPSEDEEARLIAGGTEALPE